MSPRQQREKLYDALYLHYMGYTAFGTELLDEVAEVVDTQYIEEPTERKEVKHEQAKVGYDLCKP